MLSAIDLKVGYGEKIIVPNFSFDVRKGEMVSIIGPNGSGKSTVLKTLCRFLHQKEGTIYIEGDDMKSLNTKNIAKKMAALSQVNRSPEDITVEELIYYGRIPHKKWYEMKNKKDDDIVKWAISETSLINFRNKKVINLSGGERQRVWIAMALAQEPKIILLDEPTTYLDICHQLEVMELIKRLNKELNLTVIMVLHDLGQAAKYSDKLVVLKKGKTIAIGSPRDILTEKLVREVYNVETCIRTDVITNELIIYPIGICKCEKKKKECESIEAC